MINLIYDHGGRIARSVICVYPTSDKSPFYMRLPWARDLMIQGAKRGF